MLETGVNLEYDQALRQAAGQQTTPQLLATMIEEGYLPQLAGHRWRPPQPVANPWGSPGLAYLAAAYAEVLAAHGVGQDELRVLFVANPARWLAAGYISDAGFSVRPNNSVGVVPQHRRRDLLAHWVVNHPCQDRSFRRPGDEEPNLSGGQDLGQSDGEAPGRRRVGPVPAGAPPGFPR